MVLTYIISTAVLFAVGLFLSRRAALAAKRLSEARTRGELEAVKSASEAAAAAERARLDGESREQVFEKRRAAQEEASRIEREMARKEADLNRRAQSFAAQEQTGIARLAALEVREQTIQQAGARKNKWDEGRKQFEDEYVVGVESLAGETRSSVRDRLVSEWVEEAKQSAAAEIRRIESTVSDAEHGREAKRIMGIAVQRYQGHYLTERLLSNLPLLPGVLERIGGEGHVNLLSIQEVANVTLTPAEDGSAIRLEGQDSFGREIARRAIARLTKHGIKGDVKATAEQIKGELEREVMDLGRRAFRELEIPRAHPEIVALVGRLNWRTSYTQNQWKHAVEAAFLCGMMASEMGLDVKIARRAGLMHDIGKALTHAIDGSHAVIGADYARRLGESELVANAIGAHHTDEPFNSVYALLVAASDAMSGARPGARRQQDDNYAERLSDLERIGGNHRGVERAFAVHGGREVRVYVQEGSVSDLRAVELSTEIAKQISDEMTFPGQIKVTVIREHRAIEIAG